MLMPVMSRPAMASPRTNLLAPSIAPKNSVSVARSLRRPLASGVADDAGREVGVDGHLLAGQCIQREARGDL